MAGQYLKIDVFRATSEGLEASLLLGASDFGLAIVGIEFEV